MVVNDGVIASFVVTANMHPSTHVTTSLILICYYVVTVVQYIAVGK